MKDMKLFMTFIAILAVGIVGCTQSNRLSNPAVENPSRKPSVKAQVGSSVTYDVEESDQSGNTSKFNMITTITAIDANKVTLEFKKLDENGNQLSLNSGETDLSIFSIDGTEPCTKNDIPLETITVPAGTFQVCKITSSPSNPQDGGSCGMFTNTYWYGNVLFQQVKSVTECNGVKTTSVLSAVNP